MCTVNCFKLLLYDGIDFDFDCSFVYLAGLTSTSIGGQTNLKKEETRKLYRTVSLLLLLYGNLKLF
jgi:hypothetical protein